MTEPVRYQAATRYDKEACDALAYLMVKRLRVWPRRILLLTGILSIAGATWYMLQAGEVTVAPILLLLVGNIVSLFGLYARQFSAKMLLASMGRDAVNTYSFTDTEMTVRDAQGNEHAYGYAFIRRVIRMSGYLFFCMKDGQMYLLKEDASLDRRFEGFLEQRLTSSEGK